MIRSLLTSWIAQEPAASLLVAMAALILFGVTFSRLGGDEDRAWAWLRRLIEALFKSLAFVALLAMVYFILTSSYASFNKINASFTTPGSLSNLAWQRWRDLYGDPLVQQDLVVTQYLESRGPIALPTATPSGPVLYVNAKSEQARQQNSITGFLGRVTINLVDPQHQADSFNGFALSARYEYEITNPADQVTRAEFRFPLQSTTKLYQDIQVVMNGAEVPSWRVVDGVITWEQPMQPGQKDQLSIEYITYGMNGYLFEIPQPREVMNFKLTVAMDTDNC